MPFLRLSISDREPMEPGATMPAPESEAMVILGNPSGPHTEIAGTAAALRLLANVAGKAAQMADDWPRNPRAEYPVGARGGDAHRRRGRRVLGVKPETVAVWAKKGELPSIRIGGSWRHPERAVRNLAAARRKGGPR
jgi:hypothetical protein